jgi:uncharacterized protein YecA (UPF0149 family)
MDDRNGRIYTKKEINNLPESFDKKHLIKMEVEPTISQLSRHPKRVLKKENCPCGSGKQFRYCCLQNKGR